MTVIIVVTEHIPLILLHYLFGIVVNTSILCLSDRC